VGLSSGCSVGSLGFAVADRNDLEFTYSLIDRIFRLSLGELADFSGAKYDGDFSLSLEDAQRRKHEYVAERIGIGPGRRLLDLGCGWGPLLNFVRERRGEGVGVTLSSAQAESCRRHGLDVRLIDVREVGRDTFGGFHAVASLGAFEHFCSPEDYRAGRQDNVYRDVFARAASVLPDGGRLYLQTMVFGRKMIPIDAVSIEAPPESDAWYLALMQHQFPGSFLPFGPEYLRRRAVLRPGGEFKRPPGLHRDDQAVARPLRESQLAQDRDEGSAPPPLPHQPPVPAGVHLRREREQRVLRARAARPLSARVREALKLKRSRLGGRDRHACRQRRDADMSSGTGRWRIEQ
jgi:cyclopropane-fatty-acyl-phospholipid synthase